MYAGILNVSEIVIHSIQLRNSSLLLLANPLLTKTTQKYLDRKGEAHIHSNKYSKHLLLSNNISLVLDSTTKMSLRNKDSKK